MDLSLLKFDEEGLIPAVICDYQTNEVLMVGYMNEEAVRRTVQSGRTVFWSRSRQEYWVKGEHSGHRQCVKWIRLDCDGDCLLVGVEQIGGACHEGYGSCFFRELRGGRWEKIVARVFDPDQVYEE